MASTFSQTQSKHPTKQIKKQHPCFELLPPTLGMIMLCFCECRPSLTTLIPERHYSSKAMICTHKIKSKKEYEFSKQKKNWNGSFSVFCFKNPNPFHNHSTIKEHLDLVNRGHHGVEIKIKKNKKKESKGKLQFQESKVQASGFYKKISTLIISQKLLIKTSNLRF